jgi:hypothetical protein
MRSYANLEDLLHQVEYFVQSLSGYRSDFALFPEFFNAPLMAKYNHLSEPDAIRELAKFTQPIKEKMAELSIISNAMGQTVANGLNISALSSGIYYVKLKTNKGNIVKKIIKD